MPKSSQQTINQGDASDNILRCYECDKKWEGKEQRTLQKLIKLHMKLSHPTVIPIELIRLPQLQSINGKIK